MRLGRQFAPLRADLVLPGRGKSSICGILCGRTTGESGGPGTNGPASIMLAWTQLVRLLDIVTRLRRHFLDMDSIFRPSAWRAERLAGRFRIVVIVLRRRIGLLRRALMTRLRGLDRTRRRLRPQAVGDFRDASLRGRGFIIADGMVDAGRNNGDADNAIEAFIEGRAKNDIGVLIDLLANPARPPRRLHKG